MKQEKTLEKAKVDNVYEIETDSVQWYLKQAGVGPLLTKEEEIELAYLIQEGSDEARQKMISSNLRLVINQAIKYVTYTLSWWIKQAITRAISDLDKAIRLPVHFCEDIQ